MTDEQIRIAIAEACGWSPTKCMDGSTIWNCGIKRADSVFFLPDYLNDLNACHQMEETLTGIELVKYAREVRDVCWADGEDGDDIVTLVRSTARQRCIAFLRAKGIPAESPNVETKE